MIVIVAKLKTCRENIEEMKAALLDMVSKVKMKKAPWFTPCIRTTEIPPFFCFMKNIKMLLAHSTTPYFKALFKTIKPMLDGEPEIAMYGELSGIN